MTTDFKFKIGDRVRFPASIDLCSEERKGVVKDHAMSVLFDASYAVRDDDSHKTFILYEHELQLIEEPHGS